MADISYVDNNRFNMAFVDEYEYDYEDGVLNQNVLPWVLVQAMSLLLGGFGNGIFIISFVKNRECRTTLTTLLSCMSVIHVLYLVATCPLWIVSEVSDSWILGDFLCKALPFLYTAVSVFTTGILSVICLYMLMSVFCQQSGRVIFGRNYAGILFGAIVVISCFVALPAFFIFSDITIGYSREISICTWSPSAEVLADVHAVCLASILFVASMFMAVSYSVAYGRLRTTDNRIISDDDIQLEVGTSNGNTGKETLPDNQSYGVSLQELKMLLVISLLHLLLNLPVLISEAVVRFYRNPPFFWAMFLSRASVILPLLNYCIYPLIYGLMLTSIRKYYKRMLCCCLGK